MTVTEEHYEMVQPGPDGTSEALVQSLCITGKVLVSVGGEHAYASIVLDASVVHELAAAMIRAAVHCEEHVAAVSEAEASERKLLELGRRAARGEQ